MPRRLRVWIGISGFLFVKGDEYIGGNGDVFSPDTGDPGAGTEPADTRTYVTVTIGYNEELRLAELDRRGLTYEGKIGRLEVEE